MTGLGDTGFPGRKQQLAFQEECLFVGLQCMCVPPYLSAPLESLVLVIVSRSLSESFNLCFMVLHELSSFLKNYPKTKSFVFIPSVRMNGNWF